MISNAEFNTLLLRRLFMTSVFFSIEHRKHSFHVNGKIYLLEMLFEYELIKQYQLIFFYFRRDLMKVLYAI
jgi:hypothetical protein